MMVVEDLEVEESPFLTSLKSLYARVPADILSNEYREKAWQRFLKLGLPTKKAESFQYIKLSKLYREMFASTGQSADNLDIEPYLLPETAGSTLVFVNGEFQPTLSRTQALPSKIVVLPLSEAMQAYGTLLANHYSKTCLNETDPFALLNLALHGEGLFLYIPPRTNCSVPLHILHLVQEQVDRSLLFPRVQLFLGASSTIEVVSTHVSQDSKGHFVNQVLEAQVEENARLSYVQMNNHAESSLWHFDAVRAMLKKDSYFAATQISGGSRAVRNDYLATLTGANAEVSLNGLNLLTDKREAHCHILVNHLAPACLSRQLFKNILDEFSHASFEGKILVQQLAQQTNAFQLNNNLLLSDYANAESKPNLEIFADDVKASHGATVGQLDKEELFYLQSRGFTLPAATNLLIHGFCQDVVETIPLPSLRDQIRSQIRQFSSGTKNHEC